MSFIDPNKKIEISLAQLRCYRKNDVQFIPQYLSVIQATKIIAQCKREKIEFVVL